MKKGRKNASQRRTAFAEEPSYASKASVGRTTAAETPVTIRGIGITVDPEERAYIRQRLGFRLGKFALGVRRVEVHLVDVSGPRGAPTRACRISALLDNSRDVFVEIQAASPRAAIDAAIDRTERGVRRGLQRTRDGTRSGRSP
jgi:ribosome-associated translation inhibitor RaiA